MQVSARDGRKSILQKNYSEMLRVLRNCFARQPEFDVFLICPVRNQTEEEQKKINDYIERLEAQGYKVYYPKRDTDQEDKVGFRICTDNKWAIVKSKEVHMFYSPTSQGSVFDLGIMFGQVDINELEHKPFKCVNIEDVEPTPGVKSFQNVIIEMHERSKPYIKVV